MLIALLSESTGLGPGKPDNAVGSCYLVGEDLAQNWRGDSVRGIWNLMIWPRTNPRKPGGSDQFTALLDSLSLSSNSHFNSP